VTTLGPVSTPPVRTIPATAGETTPERPWPVRLLSAKLTDYVSRAPAVWVEGQVVQLTRRPGQSICYLTLRDPDVDLSFSVTVHQRVLDGLPVPLRDGSRVVLHARTQLWPRRGSLNLVADQIRPVGVGELLVQLDQLRRVLAAEGLFAAQRKKPLPFLPRRIGLICGRASAAEHDVIENATRRWPAVSFVKRAVAVQGPRAVEDVVLALQELDRIDEVDVIVIARGGGSLEDLLPFSNETLVRAAGAARTPIVSAIGHEVDQPLLDLVADVRASTPTDAAKLIVPDVEAELALVRHQRARGRAAQQTRINRELALVESLRDRPVLSDPARLFQRFAEEIAAQRARGTRATLARVRHALQDVEHLRLRVRALSPAATLARGYAVARTEDGRVLRAPAQAPPGTRLRIRLDEGELTAEAT
jgi:exodeoxyribonuclease VII large subunit